MRMLLSKHRFSVMEKSHSERAGVHWPRSTPTVASSVSCAHTPCHHRNHLWRRLGLSRRVSSTTTASLGRPNDMTPGQNAAVVHMMARCFWSSVSRSKCLPLPAWTASVESAVET
jgi:hypothetical protein